MKILILFFITLIFNQAIYAQETLDINSFRQVGGTLWMNDHDINIDCNFRTCYALQFHCLEFESDQCIRVTPVEHFIDHWNRHEINYVMDEKFSIKTADLQIIRQSLDNPAHMRVLLRKLRWEIKKNNISDFFLPVTRDWWDRYGLLSFPIIMVPVTAGLVIYPVTYFKNHLKVKEIIKYWHSNFINTISKVLDGDVVTVHYSPHLSLPAHGSVNGCWEEYFRLLF